MPSASVRSARLLAACAALALCCGHGDDPPPPAAPAVSTAPCPDDPFPGAPLGLRCGKLVDPQGRVVALRGVNARVDGVFDVSFDDGRKPLEPVPPFSPEDASLMASFGFDSLRLPINWSGVEPTSDGGFNEAYLDRVQAVLDAAHSAGLLVLVDFHQDAYGKDIGEDGAPLWAIQPPPEKLLEGPLDDLADRRLSPQVKAAFSTFFGDSPEGAALRTRFAAMAAHVAARFKDHPAVLGFELFNEPVFTTSAQLLRLHQEVFASVRAAAPQKLVLFEPPAERNFLDQISGGSAPIGPGTAYAPHIYKYAFSKFPPGATKESLAKQNRSAPAEAASWGAGLVITEWGYDPRGERADEYLTWQSELQEEIQASSFLWLWKEDSQGSWGCFDAVDGAWQERPRFKQILARVRPLAVAGWPRSYSFDRPSGAFSLSFTSDPTVKAPTLISIAPALGAPLEVRCDGTSIQSSSPPGALPGVIAVDCGGGSSSEHTLTIQVAPLP